MGNTQSILSVQNDLRRSPRPNVGGPWSQPFLKNTALSSATLSSRHYLHLLATADVEGWFVREIMLSLDGISVGGTKHKREREGSPL